VAEVAAKTLTTDPPTYGVIMELDKKVREFPLPEGLEGKDGKLDVSVAFQRCVLEHVKDVST
jgi:hypothetical protein